MLLRLKAHKITSGHSPCLSCCAKGLRRRRKWRMHLHPSPPTPPLVLAFGVPFYPSLPCGTRLQKPTHLLSLTTSKATATHMAMVQNQWYHFGIGAAPILVYFMWGLGCSYGGLTHGHITPPKDSGVQDGFIASSCHSPGAPASAWPMPRRRPLKDVTEVFSKCGAIRLLTCL